MKHLAALFALLALIALAVVLTSCSAPPGAPPSEEIVATNSAGRVFVRVSKEGPAPAGTIGPAELWQPLDAQGPSHPFYLRMLRTPGIDGPDQFTRAF